MDFFVRLLSRKNWLSKWAVVIKQLTGTTDSIGVPVFVQFDFV